MQISVTNDKGELFPLEVSGELSVGDLKAILEAETSVAAGDMILMHNGEPLTDSGKTLLSCGLQNNDVLMLVRTEGAGSSTAATRDLPAIDWGSVTVPSADSAQRSGPPAPRRSPQSQGRLPQDPASLRRFLQSNPGALAQLRQGNPRLADLAVNGSEESFRDEFERQQRMVREREMQRIRLHNADPFDPNAQSTIAREIDNQNIEENLAAAIEYNPESFGKVVMLYVEVRVNGVSVKALVDSGAHSTIMSDRCASRCSIMRLVDRRFAGMAYGIGRQRIIGRVHLGQIQIGRDFLASSFQVLEDQAEDMLLGLDMLRRHQCCIDLKKNVLRIGSTGNETPFLSEKDLQEKIAMQQRQFARGMEDEEGRELASAIAHSENSPTTSTSPGASVAPPTAAQPTTAPPTATPTRPQFPQESIARITSAGFTEQQAAAELQRCGGDAELALVSLLARSIQF